MKKDFQKWMRYKAYLESRNTSIHFISVRDIWWCSLGENMGMEMDGKHNHFTRPVVVLRKWRREMILVVPLTTHVRKGYGFHTISFRGQDQTALLNQIRTISTKRLDAKMGTLGTKEYIKLKEALSRLFC